MQNKKTIIANTSDMRPANSRAYLGSEEVTQTNNSHVVTQEQGVQEISRAVGNSVVQMDMTRGNAQEGVVRQVQQTENIPQESVYKEVVRRDAQDNIVNTQQDENVAQPVESPESNVENSIENSFLTEVESNRDSHANSSVAGNKQYLGMSSGQAQIPDKTVEYQQENSNVEVDTRKQGVVKRDIQNTNSKIISTSNNELTGRSEEYLNRDIETQGLQVVNNGDKAVDNTSANVIKFNHLQTSSLNGRDELASENKLVKSVVGDSIIKEESKGQAIDEKKEQNSFFAKEVGSVNYEEYDNRLDKKVGNFLQGQKSVNALTEQKLDTTGASNDFYNNTAHIDTFKQKAINFLPNIVGERRLSIIPLVTGAMAASIFIAVVGFAAVGFQAKEDIEVMGATAVNYIKEAKIDLQSKNFESATTNLVAAKQEFEEAQGQIDKLGGDFLDVFEHVPFLSKLSSGKNVVALGSGLTDAVVQLSTISSLLEGIGNPLDFEDDSRASLTNIFVEIQKNVALSKESLRKAEEASSKINLDDLPTEYRDKISFVKEFLPLVNDNLAEFDRSASVFLELFGHYSAKKYIIVFQNNQEMRATGGFIGSYGLLETSGGKIDKLKIEGIYNPDGQLKVDVVPPRPIQKISSGWSMHDANWFPDFPKSAEKIAWFYEKTGGPTADGVIAVTPVLLQKMLEVTGPIEMPEYDKTVTSRNFIRTIQQQVEVDYDKEENKPKQILSDLTPKLFAKFFDLKGSEQAGAVVRIVLDSLKEKHILINFRDKDIQSIISEQGWSGEVLQTTKDYLMVVNSNINGYKTDGVIEEIVKHQAKIESDGSVVDTVTITRKHRGGKTEYEWWNKVNANYMRVYVPKGSKLISVSGQTREFNEERLNYDKLGFQVDDDVVYEETYMEIDQESGTRMYEESGKTVFANWVYVSPQEEVTITYKYSLPFKVNVMENKEDNRYSLLVQKQSGSVNSTINAEIEFPFKWKTTWLEPKNLEFNKSKNQLLTSHSLTTDQFVGAVFKVR